MEKPCGKYLVACLLTFLAAFGWIAPAAAQAALPRLEIIVPGSPNGGFDKNAQALARTLRSEGLVDQVIVRHSPGAGGLIALAQFVAAPAPDVPTVFIGGTTILGAATENRSVVSLGDLAPIAQLNQISLVIVVRKDGPVSNLNELLHLIRTRPDRFEWVGGSPGSKDEMLLLALARKMGLPRDRFNYIANPGGGAIVGERLLQGRHLAAATSLEEFEDFADRDKMRIVAVSSAARLPGIDVPTLREGGLDLSISDWKGVFASRRASPQELERIRSVIGLALASPSWQQELARQKWARASADPAAFQAAIADGEREAKQLVHYSVTNEEGDSLLREILERPWRFFLYALGAAAFLAVVIFVQRRAGTRREVELRRTEAELEDMRHRISENAAGEKTEITSQLQAWSLSVAEIEIAWMILKGLQFKEIAAARGTSERTVRQQAQTIYAKSGMASRTEFAAHFLESLRF